MNRARGAAESASRVALHKTALFAAILQQLSWRLCTNPQSGGTFGARPLWPLSARIARAVSWRRHLPLTSRAVSSVATEAPSSRQGLVAISGILPLRGRCTCPGRVAGWVDGPPSPPERSTGNEHDRHST